MYLVFDQEWVFLQKSLKNRYLIRTLFILDNVNYRSQRDQMIRPIIALKIHNFYLKIQSKLMKNIIHCIVNEGIEKEAKSSWESRRPITQITLAFALGIIVSLPIFFKLFFCIAIDFIWPSSISTSSSFTLFQDIQNMQVDTKIMETYLLYRIICKIFMSTIMKIIPYH